MIPDYGTETLAELKRSRTMSELSISQLSRDYFESESKRTQELLDEIARLTADNAYLREHLDFTRRELVELWKQIGDANFG